MAVGTVLVVNKKTLLVLLIATNALVQWYFNGSTMINLYHTEHIRSSLNNRLCTNKKWIVLTTIFYPTPAVERFLTLDEWKLIVIGDRKTPSDCLSRVHPCLSEQKKSQLWHCSISP